MSGAAPHQVGDAAKKSVTMMSHGKERLVLHGDDAIFQIALVETEPTLGVARPMLFMRSSGGKQQLCVRFSSGVTQVVSTEP